MGTLRRLRELGQSVWLDYLDQRLLRSEELAGLIAEDGLAGLTSNPSIFQKAIAGSSDYDETIRGASPSEPDASILERIMAHDVAQACDRFLPLWENSRGADGFVSIEVSPELAYDTEATVADARRLWSTVARPNLMVKIPGTREGVAAVARCLVDGMNVNVTLLFSVGRYLEVAEAYERALEARAARLQALDVASVASFFVSRIDARVDRALDALPAGPARDTGRRLRGCTAIANAKLAYDAYQHVVDEEPWRKLAAQGARPQRLLWASTSTKDPAYPDVHYADSLVAPDTVDTMTLETLRAYRDHGSPEVRITRGLERAREQLATLAALGVDFDRVTREIEDEGVRAFVDSHRRALATIADKRRAVAPAAPPGRAAHP